MEDNSLVPFFSIVTVNFNDSMGLRETVDSLRRQSLRDFEHVIIDGLSTDGSAEFIQKYARSGSNVTAVIEKDDGIYDAMNKGISRSRGNIVVFMNAGDRFSDDDVLSFILEDYKASPWDWGYGCMRYMTEEGEVFGAAVQAPFKRRKFYMGFAFAPHQATYLTRSLLKDLGGFDTSFGVACDQELAMRASCVSEPRTWVRFLCDFRVGGVHTDISFYRRENIWHRMRVKNGHTLMGSAILDRISSLAIAIGRTGRQALSRRVREIG